MFGKAALGVHGNPAAAGVRAELGLVELQFRRQALKLRWWDRLCSVLPERLLSLVFRRRHNEILSGGARYSGLQSMKDLLLSYGFSEEWLQRRSDLKVNVSWTTEVKAVVNLRALASASANIAGRSSLSLLSLRPHGIAHYLDDRKNMAGTRLLAKVRLGHIMVMATVARMLGWPANRALCLLCHDDIESVRHFVQDCPVLDRSRAKFVRGLELPLSLSGAVGLERLDMLRRSGSPLLDSVISCSVATSGDGDRCQVDAAVESAVKNCLSAMWRIRESVLGRVGVAAGRLVVSPPSGPRAAELIARQEAN